MIILLAESLASGLKSSSQEFVLRFEKTFGLKEKGFDDNQIYFAQTILSNLIGGIGYLFIFFYLRKALFLKHILRIFRFFLNKRYFYGSSIVDESFIDEDEDEFWTKYQQPNPRLTLPLALFTATPSRPFFPRGFYW